VVRSYVRVVVVGEYVRSVGRVRGVGRVLDDCTSVVGAVSCSMARNVRAPMLWSVGA